MQLSEDYSDATYQIQSVSPGSVKINAQTYTQSLIITPDQLITDWPPQHIDALTEADLMAFIALKPEIILLGTGNRSIIPPQKTLAPLLEKQYNVECMSTSSACRTYTILIAEGRKVAAGLIIEDTHE